MGNEISCERTSGVRSRRERGTLIRAARIEDSWSIAETQVEAWRHTYVGQIPAEYLASLSVPVREAAWRELFGDANHCILVAEESGVTQGFVSLGPSRDEDAEPESTGEVYAIYLRPGHQGRGLGSGLWREAMKVFKERGLSAITVWVLDSNSTARKFYESRGCFLDGAIKGGSIRGKGLVEVRYRYDLR